MSSRTVTFAIASLIASFGTLRVPYSITENDSQHKQTNCSQILDDLDATFDLRHEARQKALPHPNFRHVTAFDMYEPEALCITDERFGSRERYRAFGDGPKFICGVDVLAAKSNSTSDGCLVYSIGSNNDIAFEEATYNHIGCEIHTFDPTLDKPFVGDKYATFHPWGLGEDGAKMSGNRKDWVGMSMEHVLRELGHENRTIDILKIDCEGCEWTVLPVFFDLVASGKFQVNQVLVELHNFFNIPQQTINNFFSAADKARLRIFHKERNHWGCQGFKCLEYALVSESFLRESNMATVCGNK